MDQLCNLTYNLKKIKNQDTLLKKIQFLLKYHNSNKEFFHAKIHNVYGKNILINALLISLDTYLDTFTDNEDSFQYQYYFLYCYYISMVVRKNGVGNIFFKNKNLSNIAYIVDFNCGHPINNMLITDKFITNN